MQINAQNSTRRSQHSFAQTPSVHIPRSQFNRTSSAKDTLMFDELTPIYFDEVLPGDTHTVNVLSFMRLATQKVPIMDDMWVDFFCFFVPNRLIYDKWEELNGAQENPDDTVDYICPQMDLGPSENFAVGTIYDHYGLPTGVNNLLLKNTMPLRCYPLIWNEWFRDENLQDSVDVPKDQGPDVLADFTMLKRGKRHDYFTSALPWPQKGPAVELPIGSRAPVLGIAMAGNTGYASPQTGFRQSDGSTLTGTPSNWSATVNAGGILSVQGDDTTKIPNIYADLSDATAATINELREAFMMQSLFELDARGGTRYVEVLRAHFGVISPDFRLQRPEYLGGGSVRINSHPVPQTAPTSGSDPQAQLAAFGTAASGPADRIGFTKSFVEHGHILILACPRANITYQQGINRAFLRSTRYDFYWPKLQQLGEQEIFNGELYAQGTTADFEPFGYQERYGEYRYKPSEIRGQFRSTYAQPLDMWHMAQEFTALPVLNEEFIEQDTPIERAIAVTNSVHLLCDFSFQTKSARPMLSYSVPATLGRF